MHFPKNAFIDPAGHNRAEVETLLQNALTLLLDEMTQSVSRSPLPTDESGTQVQRLTQWAEIPEHPTDVDVLLTKVRSLLQHSMNAAHPGYIGHMDSIPTTLSLVGDLLVAALNNNLLSVEMSPVFSRLEPLLLGAIARRFGLGDHAGGVMVSGGSLANLQALTVARNIAFDAVKTGVVGLAHRPVFFVSAVAHTSMQKAAMMMGLGSDAAIALRTNANSQVDINDLLAKLAEAKSLGQQPFAIVATAGTTVTGNIDPIADMAQIAQDHGLWFHVDAAYGGALIFSQEHRSRLAGIEQADSVTFNPQKWLYVTKTCATVLFKNIDLLKAHFRIAAPYMGDDAQWPNLGELTIQGTRHADILKLWLSLQHLGVDSYGQIIRHSYALTKYFVQLLQARPYLQLASEPEMNLVCFRWAVDTADAAQQDQLNADLQRHLLNPLNSLDPPDMDAPKHNEPMSRQSMHQGLFLSLPVYRNQRWLKAVLLNPYTQRSTIDRLFYYMDAFVQSHG